MLPIQLPHETQRIGRLDILLSIKPKYSTLILDGTKRVEYRKKPFDYLSVVKTIFFYESAPTKRIVGCADIDRIIFTTLSRLWQETSVTGGISKEEFDLYFKGRMEGYGIVLKNVIKFEQDLDPRVINPDFTPPVSFIYLPPTTVNRNTQLWQFLVQQKSLYQNTTNV